MFDFLTQGRKDAKPPRFILPLRLCASASLR